MSNLDPAEHKARHEVLHKGLDELLADFILHTGKRPSQVSLLEFVQWSYIQTQSPTDF